MSQQYRYYHTQAAQTVRPRRHWRRYVGMAFVVIAFAAAMRYSTTHARRVADPLPKAPVAAAPQPVNTINHIITTDTADRVGVAIENLSTGAMATYGDTNPFEAASTEKVLSAIVYYHLAETGAVNLNDQLGDYTADYQIKEMINISDNDSWVLVNDAVGGNDELAAYAKTIGITYDADDNSLTAKDMALLLGMLYRGQLLSADHTNELLSYMQNTNDESMIPAVAPGDVTVYHKYGDLGDIDDAGDSVLHDAAIVVKGKQAYALVIYTSGSSASDTRTALIRQIATAALQSWGW